MDPLYLIAVLACPLGMGAMMWFMARGQKANNSPAPNTDQEWELAQLRSEMDRLRQQQNRGDIRSN